MDILEGIEVDTTKRSRRVRSWYLYEQYKALERNQQEAARQLSNKTSQDRLLYRELSEHRQRRKICSECHSEPGIHNIRNDSSHSCVTMSINDIYQSLCDLQDDALHDTADSSIKESCLWSQTISETFNMDDDSVQKICSQDTISLPHLNLEDPDYPLAVSISNLADDVKEELEFVKKSIDENIFLQLEMKANVQSLEDYVKPPECLFDDKLEKFEPTAFEDDMPKYPDNVEDSGDEDSLCSLRARSMPDKIDSNSNMYGLWAKLVSFAYQVVQLNHGNCYYDYSSQFMTAVLACDILRRGIGRMCNVLQPYVSPVKCVTSLVSTKPHSTKPPIKKDRSSKSKVIKKSSLGPKYTGKHSKTGCHGELTLKSPRNHGERTIRSNKTRRQCFSDSCTTKSRLQSEFETWHSLSQKSIHPLSQPLSTFYGGTELCMRDKNQCGSRKNCVIRRILLVHMLIFLSINLMKK